MSRKLDYIIVIDLEATCWKSKTEQGNQQSEIIEIGIATLVVLDKSVHVHPCATCHKRKKRNTFYSCKVCHNRGILSSILITPTASRVSAYCSDLTGHTQEDLDKRGISFPSAITRLQRWYGPRNRIWASWGNYDRYLLEKQCAEHNVSYPFGPTHINVKDLFAVRFSTAKALGMAAALDHAEMPLIGRHHSGADDAWNVAKLLGKALER